MTSFRAALTGIPEDVQAAVDRDLSASLKGPDALDRAIAAAPRDQLLARYKALCARITHDRIIQARTARYTSQQAEAADEREQLHRGGNR